MAIRKLIKEIIPSAIVQRYRKSKIRAERSHFSVMSTADVFDEIYRKKLWAATAPMASFAQVRGHAALPPGNGDLCIGKAIIEWLGQRVNYTWADVSPYVIAYNREYLTFPLFA
jgi:hypothetical protein